MAKGIYVGIGGVKKGKKLFVGIGGAARKVKKVFVGAGGVKCVYSGDPAKVTTSIAPLSVERSALAATSVGNYALFAGGENYRSSFGTGLWNTVDAYNTSLEHSTPGHIFYTRRDFAATSIGNYAIFAGGVGENGAIGSVVAFNTALETSTSTLSRAKSSHAATNNNKYAIFVGGTAFTDVDAFNSSLERTKATAIKAPTTNLAAAKVGNYAVFAGGQEYTGSAVTPAVIAYNDSLGYTAFGSTSDNALSLKRINLAGASIGNYAIFAGGYYDYVYRDITDAYDTSLTRYTPTPLSAIRDRLSATSLKNYALFAGGRFLNSNKNFDYANIVDAYDASLVRHTFDPLSEERFNFAATSIGNYAIFAGGRRGDFEERLGTVDVYEE